MKRLSSLLVIFFLIIGYSSFAQTQDDTIKYISWEKLSISIAGKTTIRLGKKISYASLSVSEILNADSIVLIGNDSDKYVIESYYMFLEGRRLCDKSWNCKGSKICYKDFSRWASHPFVTLNFANIIVIDKQKKRRKVYNVSFILTK